MLSIDFINNFYLLCNNRTPKLFADDKMQDHPAAVARAIILVCVMLLTDTFSKACMQ